MQANLISFGFQLAAETLPAFTKIKHFLNIKTIKFHFNEIKTIYLIIMFIKKLFFSVSAKKLI